MWPANYIRSFLNTYIDYENILNIKKVPVLLQKQPKNQFTWACTGPLFPNLSLMWPAKQKELPTPALRACNLERFRRIKIFLIEMLMLNNFSW